MGGGDLNAKKAWHPNTLKNQERVWKAEQAAAEEKKRIVELERERQLERERTELNKLAKANLGPPSTSNDDRLHWMYEKPDKKVQQEEYLLGRAIDKTLEQAGKTEKDEIPAVSRRVVGSSMITIAGDTQVDLARKLREDPLLLVKEREREARAALLNNPVQRARLTELLRKEQESKKGNKSKKDKKNSKNLDNVLAEKLQALGGDKGIDLNTLLDSDDSSSDSSNEKSKKKKRKKKHKKRKTKRKKESLNDSDLETELQTKSKDGKKASNKSGSKRKRASSESDDYRSKKKKNTPKYRGNAKSDSKVRYKNSSNEHSSDEEQLIDHRKPIKTDHKRRNSESDSQYSGYKKHTRDNSLYKEKQHSKYNNERCSRSDGHVKGNRYSKEYLSKDDKISRDNRQIREKKINSDDRSRGDRHSDDKRNHRDNYNEKDNEFRNIKRIGLTTEEKAAKLAEMVAAGAEREKQRERRVAEQLQEIEKADKVSITKPRSRNVINQLPDSLESRIHSNRHYIQRDQRHMNEHFARR